jgi:hypothetical protein
MNRSELAQAIAIDRADYERTYAGREDAWQPLLPFVKSVAYSIAKRRPVQGIRATRHEYGWSISARIDWKKLTARVEAQLPGWREAVARADERAS